MGHTTRERTRRFHPLDLVEPLLHLLRRQLHRETIGDVADDEVGGGLTMVHEGDGPHFDFEVGAVQSMESVSHGRGELQRADRIGEPGLNRLEVGRVEERVDR